MKIQTTISRRHRLAIEASRGMGVLCLDPAGVMFYRPENLKSGGARVI